MAQINVAHNPGENEAVGRIGKSVFCTPIMEDDPKRPGVKRVKRDEQNNVLYTQASLSAYEEYNKRLDTEADPLGAAVTDNPVLQFYRTEFGYQRDPGKARPRSGPFAAKQDIPKDVLKILMSETLETKKR